MPHNKDPLWISLDGFDPSRLNGVTYITYDGHAHYHWIRRTVNGENFNVLNSKSRNRVVVSAEGLKKHLTALGCTRVYIFSSLSDAFKFIFSVV